MNFKYKKYRKNLSKNDKLLKEEFIEYLPNEIEDSAWDHREEEYSASFTKQVKNIFGETAVDSFGISGEKIDIPLTLLKSGGNNDYRAALKYKDIKIDKGVFQAICLETESTISLINWLGAEESTHMEIFSKISKILKKRRIRR